MSFDFFLFDPTVAPREDEAFKAWYDAELSGLDNKGAYDCAIPENDAFRAFYGEMREMFTPFNGPDDVPLPDDASQPRLYRTCEYHFRPHSLYMAFRRPAQDMARAAASTFAKAFGLGYYHCSAPYGQAVFPDGHTAWPGGKYPGHGAGKALT